MLSQCLKQHEKNQITSGHAGRAGLIVRPDWASDVEQMVTRTSRAILEGRRPNGLWMRDGPCHGDGKSGSTAFKPLRVVYRRVRCFLTVKNCPCMKRSRRVHEKMNISERSGAIGML
jgi:hypothetical protein